MWRSGRNVFAAVYIESRTEYRGSRVGPCNGLLVALSIALPVRGEIMIHMSLGLLEVRQTTIYARILQRHPSDSRMLCRVDVSFIEAVAVAAIEEYVDTQMNALL
jgi:hypothetical protein